MELFSSTLSQMAFLFTLIVIGYILAKLNVVPDNTPSVLAKLENNVFIPALVLGTFMNNFTVEKFSVAWKILLFSMLLTILMCVISSVVGRLCNKDDFISKIYTYGLSFSNFGFMGNAVVMALFPDIFVEYLIFTLPLWMLIYLWGVPALLIPEEGGLQLMGRKARILSRFKSFINPMFACMVIGMIFGITGIGAVLPAWAGSVVKTAGDCMSPIAMILTGITVSKISLKKTFTNLNIYLVSFIRLLVYPLAYLGVVFILGKFGIHIDRTIFICALCTLAMPLGLNTIVIPSAYGKDPTVASGMALVSHILSCVTIPVIFMLI